MRQKIDGRFAGPTRRIAVASGLIVVVVAVAIGVVFVRFHSSTSKFESAVATEVPIATTSNARTGMYDILNAGERYLATGSPAELDNLATFRGVLASQLQQLAAKADTAPELAALRRAGAAATIVDTSTKALPAERGTRDAAAVFDNLGDRLATLDASLDAVAVAERQEAITSRDAARSSASSARIAGLIAGAVAILMVLALAVYVVRLVSRLLDRMRVTSGQLGEAANEMRAAMGEAAAATTEQSAAISEVAVTIEEMSVSSTAIADNAQTTATEALETGERSQQIGEVLGLINGIAEQTNLLALNAAIEAARAGDAGRGFAVVASEIRKLAERRVHSTESISQIATGIQEKSNSTILATENSMAATDHQKEAAEQAASTMVEIRSAAEQLAAEQQQRAGTAERVEGLVHALEGTLSHYRAAPTNGRDSADAPLAAGH
jgi:methyl-accepting chemotaxis protein